MSSLDVVVATIGKAHGLRGEVTLALRTDQPETRLAPGTVFTAPTGGGERTLTVARTRVQQDRWYARFEEVADRTDAESLRGIDLTAEVDPTEEAEQDPDAWYLSELEGMTVRHVEGHELGTLTDLEHYPAHDVLIVRTPEGRRVMLPFVEQLVPEVDPEAGVILVDPPGGLFDPENTEGERG